MHNQRQFDSFDYQPLPGLQGPSRNQSTVFPGKPYQQHVEIQRSIMEIFDEFTEIISGELKINKLK